MVMVVRADLFRSAYEIMHEPREKGGENGRKREEGREKVDPTEKKEQYCRGGPRFDRCQDKVSRELG